MLRYILRRLLGLPVVLLILVTITFFLARVAPGGPFSADKNVPPEIKANIEAKYHLDKPLHVQYGRYLRDVVTRGDLGPSFKHKDQTVNEIIERGLPVSFQLGFLAAIFAVTFGVSAGVIASIRQNSWFDYGSMSVAVLGMTIPNFVVGPILVLLFARYWKVFNVAGWEELKDMVLPAITLGLPFAARIARLTRAGMLEIVGQDFIRTARAKGLAERVVIVRHALKGGLLPVVSFLGPGLSYMMVGSLVVERIFRIPGLGQEFIESALNRDYTLVNGTVLVYGVILVVMNLIVDVVYGYLDPRIRYD